MPKKVPEQQLDAIVEIIAAYPGGVRVGGIRDGLAIGLPLRMLQRRLALLVEQKRLIADDRGRGRRYRLPPSDAVVTPAPAQHVINEPAAVRMEVYPPVSPAVETIKQAVRAPIQSRRPVGYRRDFLDDYRPNETSYLPPATRQRLLGLGRSPDGQLPAGTHARKIYGRLLIDLSWNSSCLEGNTYSLLETERLLELGETAEDKDALEAQMILNHKGAIELLVEQAEEVGFNRYTILNLHALLSFRPERTETNAVQGCIAILERVSD